MNPSNGGQTYSDERQRQTAAEISRKKVLSAFGHANSTATSSPNPTPDWQKYHSAWQDYYQKYYSTYYAKAARKYIESEQQTKPQTPALPKLSPAEIETSLKSNIQQKAHSKFKFRKKSRKLIPILAGLTVMLLILFLQYNRIIFAPIIAYVAPASTKDTGITAINPTTAKAPTKDPRLIIPKLNVDVPVNFNISNDTQTVMNAMNYGVAHFKIPGASALPGEKGNLVITGHSAGDIYSNNQYKFIFSGLERLNENDLIYVNYQSKRYTYSVRKKETVEPSNVNALVRENNKPILTLITCTPLGTSRYRLLVTADQIDPAPATATAPKSSTQKSQVTLPANEKSFFEKIWNWLTGNH